jgi:hypothetical protein
MRGAVLGLPPNKSPNGLLDVLGAVLGLPPNKSPNELTDVLGAVLGAVLGLPPNRLPKILLCANTLLLSKRETDPIIENTATIVTANMQYFLPFISNLY